MSPVLFKKLSPNTWLSAKKKMTAFWDIFLSGTLRIKMQCVHKLIQQNLSKEINKTCAYKNIT